MTKRKHTPQPYHAHASAFNTENAAIHIGEPSSSLKISRRTGLLCGHPAPEFKKSGRKVFYMRKTLENWLDGLPAYKNTAQFQVEEV